MNYVTVRRPTNGMNDFDRIFRSIFDDMPSWTDQKPAVDIRSTENDYIVDADLPGFTEEQIDVRVENELLVISARDDEEKKEESSFMIRERHLRSFYRSFALPKDADIGSIDASYRNGVLTLTIHKKEEAKPRQIQINRG